MSMEQNSALRSCEVPKEMNLEVIMKQDTFAVMWLCLP